MIGVIGAGYVGNAVISALQCGYVVVDPQYTDNDLSHTRDAEAVFICVPTPSSEDGSNDDSIVRQVLDGLSDDQLIILKSTVTPELFKDYGHKRLVFSPELLRANHAQYDFQNPSVIVFGGKPDDCAAARALYERCFPPFNALVIFTTHANASLFKYAVNSFLATKVVFMNEMFKLCEKAGGDWADISMALGFEGRVGHTHMTVPGEHGYGFSGACFPKDTSALLRFAERYGVDLSVLSAAVETNQLLRTGETHGR